MAQLTFCYFSQNIHCYWYSNKLFMLLMYKYIQCYDILQWQKSELDRGFERNQRL